MLAEHRCFRGIDGLTYLTEYQRALYQQWLPKRSMIVLPLGAAKSDQTQAQNIKERRKKRRVAYIGHLHNWPTPDISSCTLFTK